MRIKKAWIDHAEEYGACQKAIRWLRRRPRTLRQLAEYMVGSYEQGYIWLRFALEQDILPREAQKPAKEALKAANQWLVVGKKRGYR